MNIEYLSNIKMEEKKVWKYKRKKKEVKKWKIFYSFHFC
jgi:hypothetical protein